MRRLRPLTVAQRKSIWRDLQHWKADPWRKPRMVWNVSARERRLREGGTA